MDHIQPASQPDGYHPVNQRQPVVAAAAAAAAVVQQERQRATERARTVRHCPRRFRDLPLLIYCPHSSFLSSSPFSPSSMLSSIRPSIHPSLISLLPVLIIALVTICHFRFVKLVNAVRKNGPEACQQAQARLCAGMITVPVVSCCEDLQAHCSLLCLFRAYGAAGCRAPTGQKRPADLVNQLSARLRGGDDAEGGAGEPVVPSRADIEKCVFLYEYGKIPPPGVISMQPVQANAQKGKGTRRTGRRPRRRRRRKRKEK
jgi:hypothetical protein